MIENSDNLSLEMFLGSFYEDLLKSVNKEKYIIDYDNFDLFCQITNNDEVVGFITLENNDNSLIINECYIRPDERGQNLFFKTYFRIINNTEKQVFIRKPNKNLINVLLHNNLAFKLSGNIVMSYVDFIIELKDTYINSKIKHNYKKITDDTVYFLANLFDLDLSATLFFDDKRIYSKCYDFLCICEARKYDLKKYSIRKKLKKIQLKYINETFETISNNLTESFDFFKNLNEDLSNSNKRRNQFLKENPEFKNKNEDKFYPISEFIFDCPFCGEKIQKSSIYCHNCGFNIEKTLIKEGNKSSLVRVDEVNDYEDEYSEYINQDDDEMQSSLDEMGEIFGSDEEMKGAFSKLLKAVSDLSEISKELKKEPVKSLGIIDYNLLEINRCNYDAEEEKKLNIEKSNYALVKYTNEHPTPWMFDYHLESVDGKDFDRIIEKGYITKVMPDKFPELFESYTVEELIRESERYHDPNTPKEELIKDFQEEAYYSWIVSEKGLNYLEKYPFLDFFTNNLLGFNIYEFKLFADKFDGVLDFDEIGDKYINAKLTKALSDNELDMYLYYVDYYFNLYYSKNEYDAALKYLIQRIIYELNTWHLKERHVSFDEPFSIRTDYLMFKITKLNIDFDLESIYDNAYTSLEIDELKFKYDENYSHIKRLMADEDIYHIGGELLKKALGR